MNTPVLDLARDPRWGRMEETYGEDVHLVTQMGLAAVRGLQGPGDTIDSDHVVAAVKHLAGYGQCAGGRNSMRRSYPYRNMCRRRPACPGERAIPVSAVS